MENILLDRKKKSIKIVGKCGTVAVCYVCPITVSVRVSGVCCWCLATATPHIGMCIYSCDRIFFHFKLFTH